MIFFLPIYLQLGHRVSAQVSGLLLLPVTAGMVIAALAASKLLGRTGEAHWIPVGGMSLAAAALLLLGLLPDDQWLVIGLGFLTGLGLGVGDADQPGRGADRRRARAPGRRDGAHGRSRARPAAPRARRYSARWCSR